jgi:O-antigen/teichoic acid export membrane protein
MEMDKTAAMDRASIETDSGLGARVAQASLWSAGSQVIALCGSLISTPFVIRALGTEQYGLLTLMNLVVGYLGFSDFGMGIASTKFAAEGVSRGDCEQERAVVWGAVLLTLPLLLFAVVFLVFSGDTIVRQVLRIPAHLQADTLLALRIGALILVATAMSGVFNTPQIARLRIDLNSRIAMAASFAQLGLLLGVVALGGKLNAVLCALAALSFAVAIANVVVSSRLNPGVLSPRLDPKLIRPMAAFGVGVLATALIGTVTVHGEKFLLVRAGSVSLLAYYGIASTFAGLLGILPAAMSQTLMPSFVHMRSLPDRLLTERLYGNVLRSVLLSSLPVALVLCLCARAFLSRWAGAEFGRESTLPACILIAGWVFQAMAQIPKSILVASGRIGLIARYQAIGIVPYLLLALIMIRLYGVAGAAVSWSMRVAWESIVFFILSRRIARLPFPSFNRNGPAFAAALTCLGIPFLVMQFTTYPLWIWVGAGCGIPLYAKIAFDRLLSEEQKNWVSRLIFRRLRYGK